MRRRDPGRERDHCSYVSVDYFEGNYHDLAEHASDIAIMYPGVELACAHTTGRRTTAIFKVPGIYERVE